MSEGTDREGPRGTGRLRFLALALAAATALAAWGLRTPWQAKAKQPSVSRYRLEAGSSTPLGDLSWMPTLGMAKCDSGTNVYLRLMTRSFQSYPFSTPVTKFSPGGDRLAEFSLDKAPGWSPGDIQDFAVGQDGTVYLLADHPVGHNNRKAVTGILSFNGDGDFLSSVPLHLPVQTTERLAVFPTGQFLVTATERAKPQGKRIPGAPVSAKVLERKGLPTGTLHPIAFLVDQRGEEVKRVLLPQDPLSIKNGKGYGPPISFNADKEGFEWLVAGDEGNVYAIFPTGEPIVYAISPAGDVLRGFFVSLPAHHTALAARWAWGYNGLLIESSVIRNQSEDTAHTLFSIIDPDSGQPTYEYTAGNKLGMFPACFAQQHIYFVGSHKGRLVLRDAEIR